MRALQNTTHTVDEALQGRLGFLNEGSIAAEGMIIDGITLKSSQSHELTTVTPSSVSISSSSNLALNQSGSRWPVASRLFWPVLIGH